jgi:hypothetical protein
MMYYGVIKRSQAFCGASMADLRCGSVWVGTFGLIEAYHQGKPSGYTRRRIFHEGRWSAMIGKVFQDRAPKNESMVCSPARLCFIQGMC